MKKKMERLTGPLFQPLTPRQIRRTLGNTPTTIYETGVPTSDFQTDGEGHN
jgi:hypothetical protein